MDNLNNNSKIKDALMPVFLMTLFFVIVFCLNIVSSPFVAEAQTFETGLVVTGVESTTQYLTSLVLYAENPTGGPIVTLSYDAETNALLVKGAINADALIVGKNTVFGENNVGFGGLQNTLSGNQSVIIGGTNNTVKNVTATIVVGGTGINSSMSLIDSAIVNSEKIGSNIKGNNLVILQGGGGLRVDGNNSVVLGINSSSNYIRSNSFVAGDGSIGPSSFSSDASGVFVWSDHDFQYNNGESFYINASSGVGLNTSYPLVAFDLGEQGILKTNTTNDLQGGLGVCNSSFAGVMAVIRTPSGSAMCGCNGTQWIPLSFDPEQQLLCRTDSSKGCSVVTPFVKTGVDHVINESGGAVRHWFSDINNGKGGWRFPFFTYGGTDPDGGTNKVCGYTCSIGYAPGVRDPDGWFTRPCEKCSGKDANGGVTTGIIQNGKWKTAGTGVNDCDFQCNAGFYYAPLERRCVACVTGERNPRDNQNASCQACQIPVAISKATGPLLGSNGLDQHNYPYFLRFTTRGTSSRVSCHFDCNAGYIAQYGGYSWDGTIATGGNACIQCPTGQYAAAGDSKCSNCTVAPDAIEFKYQKEGSLITGKVSGMGSSKLYYYTSSGTGTADSCQWKCGSGLIKVGNQCECGDKMNTHLEKVGGGVMCVANEQYLSCGSPAKTPGGEGALLGADEYLAFSQYSITDNSWKNFKWQLKEWTYKPYTDVVTAGLDACQRSCDEDYKRNGTGCLPPVGGVCSSWNGQSFMSEAEVMAVIENTEGLCSYQKNGVEVSDRQRAGVGYELVNGNYKKDGSGNVITSPNKYKWTWVCKGEKGIHTQQTYDADCVIYLTGVSAPGECDYRDDNQPACKDLDACKEEDDDGSFFCPDVVEERTIEHGIDWQCPGAYGGKTMRCGICNEGYVWDQVNYGYGCKHQYSRYACTNRYGFSLSDEGYKFGTGFYLREFSGSVGAYLGEKSWEYLANPNDIDPNDSNDACLFSCVKDGSDKGKDYTWHGGKCVHSYTGTNACTPSADTPRYSAGGLYNTKSYWLSLDETKESVVYTGKKQWTFVSLDLYDENEGFCTWTCKDGYSRSGDTCVPTFVERNCGGIKPENNENILLGSGTYIMQFNGSDYESLSINTGRKQLEERYLGAFESNTYDKQFACSFACINGTTLFKNKCVKVPSCGSAINSTENPPQLDGEGSNACLDSNPVDDLQFLTGRWEWSCTNDSGLYAKNDDDGSAVVDYDSSYRCHSKIIQPKCGLSSSLSEDFPSSENLCNSGITAVVTGFIADGRWAWICVNDVGGLWSRDVETIKKQEFRGYINLCDPNSDWNLRNPGAVCRHPNAVDNTDGNAIEGDYIPFDFTQVATGALCTASVPEECGTNTGIYLEGEDNFDIISINDINSHPGCAGGSCQLEGNSDTISEDWDLGLEGFCSHYQQGIQISKVTSDPDNPHLLTWNCHNPQNNETRGVSCERIHVLKGKCKLDITNKYQCETGSIAVPLPSETTDHGATKYIWKCQGLSSTLDRVKDYIGDRSPYNDPEHRMSQECSFVEPKCGSLDGGISDNPSESEGDFCAAGVVTGVSSNLTQGYWYWRCKNGEVTLPSSSSKGCQSYIQPICSDSYSGHNVSVFPRSSQGGACNGGTNAVFKTSSDPADPDWMRNWQCKNKSKPTTIFVDCSAYQMMNGKCGTSTRDKPYACKLSYKYSGGTRSFTDKGEIFNTGMVQLEDGRFEYTWFCRGVNSGNDSGQCVYTGTKNIFSS